VSPPTTSAGLRRDAVKADAHSVVTVAAAGVATVADGCVSAEAVAAPAPGKWKQMDQFDTEIEFKLYLNQ